MFQASQFRNAKNPLDKPTMHSKSSHAGLKARAAQRPVLIAYPPCDTVDTHGHHQHDRRAAPRARPHRPSNTRALTPSCRGTQTPRPTAEVARFSRNRAARSRAHTEGHVRSGAEAGFRAHEEVLGGAAEAKAGLTAQTKREATDPNTIFGSFQSVEFKRATAHQRPAFADFQEALQLRDRQQVRGISGIAGRGPWLQNSARSTSRNSIYFEPWQPRVVDRILIKEHTPAYSGRVCVLVISE